MSHIKRMALVLKRVLAATPSMQDVPSEWRIAPDVVESLAKEIVENVDPLPPPAELARVEQQLRDGMVMIFGRPVRVDDMVSPGVIVLRRRAAEPARR